MRRRPVLDPRRVLPVVVAVGVFALLAAFAGADPAAGVTRSISPWTDEGLNAVNARNIVLFGHPSTDDWNLWIVNLPFSVALAGVFRTLGMGIVQARLMTITATALTAGLLAAGLQRPFGTRAALVSAVAFATSLLTLYYGRLLYLEDLVVLAMTAGALTLTRIDDAGNRRAGLLGVLAGAGFAIAIGSKPNAAFAVAGLLAFVAIGAARSSAVVRRWLAGAVGTVAVAGIAWLVLLALPNRAMVSGAFTIWPPFNWTLHLHELARRVTTYPGVYGDLAVPQMWPLLIAGAGGVAAALVGRTRLDPAGRRMVLAAAGWFVVPFAVLLVASYRPNRYEVPLLPALAILAAPAVAEVARLAGRHGRRAADLAAAGIAVLLGAQGVLAYASWMSHATFVLPATQAEMARAVTSRGAAVGEYTPTLLMAAPVQAIVPWGNPPKLNGGDLYAEYDARYFLIGSPDGADRVARFHPSGWADRRLLGCATWGTAHLCLYELP